MATANRADPLPVFCFHVKLDSGGGEAFFKSVTGLRYETEVLPVREGGANDTTFMLLGATKWSPLVLKKGFTKDSGLLAWRNEWISGSRRVRRGGTITVLDVARQAKAQWAFTNGWPAKWELSELDASKSELSIETLEIVHEGLTYTSL